MLESHIYAIIIGSEILNGRRQDKHFDFLREALAQRGYTLFCSEIIKDDKALIASSFQRVLADERSLLFCFGGIGSTPDDLTRAIAAEVFTSKPLVRHKTFEQDIITRFGDKAYPNRIHMSDLPEDAQLLRNPVNNMSGFYLEDRFFFTPGFPEMAHPMVKEAITRFLPQNRTLYRQSFVAHCSEDRFIALMNALPSSIECSSLPMFVHGKPHVEISLASYNQDLNDQHFAQFMDFLKTEAIYYEVQT